MKRTITNNLLFSGQYYDEETGLHYNYFRAYKPMIGRYVEADPIGIKKGMNHAYVYVNNNPVGFGDPMGLIATPRKPGGDCIKCDFDEIARCMWKAPATPPPTVACFICIFSGFTNIPACTICGGAVGMITIECFRKHCHSGKWNKCGQCE